MRRMIVAIIATTFLASSVDAAKWKAVAMSSEGDELSVDMDTVVIQGAIRTAWVRTRSKKPDEDGAVEFRDRKQFDCEQHTVQLIYMSGYNRSGGSVFAEPPARGTVRPIIPDSVIASVFDVVCALPH